MPQSGFPQSDARGQSVGACGRRLEARGGIRASRFSIRWRKPVPVEMGDIAPSQQSFKLISLNSWKGIFFRDQTATP
jgi:hypothetical protein